MQVQDAILKIYPELLPIDDPFTGRERDFTVIDNELTEWNAEVSQPTSQELAAAWLSSVKTAKVREFEERARALASDIWLDALVELADAPRGGSPASTPNVTQLKDIRSKLGRARSAAQAVDPSKHNGDPLKAAKAVQDLKWEDL